MTDETKGNVRGPDIGKPDNIAILEKEVSSGGAIFEACQQQINHLKDGNRQYRLDANRIQRVLGGGDLSKISREIVFGVARTRFMYSQVGGAAGRLICDEYNLPGIDHKPINGNGSKAELVGRNIVDLEVIGFKSEEIKSVLGHQQDYRDWLIERLGRIGILRKNPQDYYPLHKVLELTREGYRAIKTEEGFNKRKDELYKVSDVLGRRVQYSKIQELNESRRNFEMDLHSHFPMQMKAGEVTAIMSQFPPIKNRLMLVKFPP